MLRRSPHWSTAADLRCCGDSNCVGGRAGFGGLRAAVIIPDPSGRRGAELARPPVAFEWRLRCGCSDYGRGAGEYGGRGRGSALEQVLQSVGVDGVINRIVEG